MCELLGVTSNKPIEMDAYFHTFFSHSVDHPNGWGLVLFDRTPTFLKQEPKRASKSELLQSILKDPIKTSRCIAHIRKATIGDEKMDNTHPFVGVDHSGRTWTLAHNGTIFDSDALAPYQYLQKGATDSERILLYLLDRMNQYEEEHGAPPTAQDRIQIVEDIIHTIVPGNKVNLLIFDGDLFYVHKNEVGTLYFKETEEGAIFSTTSLGEEDWTEVPQNQLLVYRDGTLLHTGQKHNHTYVYDEEQMNMLYLQYSNL